MKRSVEGPTVPLQMEESFRPPRPSGTSYLAARRREQQPFIHVVDAVLDGPPAVHPSGVKLPGQTALAERGERAVCRR